MKKMLSMQNVPKAPRKPKRKSDKRRKNLRSKLFQWLFHGIESLWMLIQIIQYLLQIFK